MLDAYFKKYFWTFNLVVIFAAAFLSARTVNAFLAQALAPTPETLTRGRSGKPVARVGATEGADIALSAFLDRNIFNAKREDIKPVPVVDDPVEAAPVDPGKLDLNNCQPSALGANLLATFVDDRRPNESMAIFQDTTPDNVTHGVRVDDQLLGQAKVLAIEWRNVFVSNGGRCESFSLEEAPKATAAAAAPVAATEPADDGKGELGDGVAKVSDNEYTIPRQEIDNVLSNLNQVATQARIVPSFHNGKANGFKLFSIRPNSLYSKIGIQNGDIVQKINGYEINSPDKALEIYSKLKDAQSITVDLVRRGKSQTLSYSIR